MQRLNPRFIPINLALTASVAVASALLVLWRVLLLGMPDFCGVDRTQLHQNQAEFGLAQPNIGST